MKIQADKEAADAIVLALHKGQKGGAYGIDDVNLVASIIQCVTVIKEEAKGEDKEGIKGPK